MRFDLPQLKMAAAYLKDDINRQATFSFYVPNLPDDFGFLVSGGVETCVSIATDLGFTSDELEYLRALGFDEASVREFSQMRFTGEIYAAPEGHVLFANEPLLELRAPIAQAQLLKPLFLNELTRCTALVSSAARFKIASQGTVRLIDDYSHDAEDEEDAVRAAGMRAIAGFGETTNLAGSRRYDLKLLAPMRSSYVSTFPTESEAFHAYVNQCNGDTVFLVDTYDVFEGICLAINVIRERRLESHSAIQINSGDLLDSCRIARKLLDHADLYNVDVLVGGLLDEHHLAWLIDEGAPVDGAAIKDQARPPSKPLALDMRCRLVQLDGKPIVVGSDKENLPGAKQIFRWTNRHSDTLALRDQPMAGDSKALLEPFVEWGEKVRLPDTIAQANERFQTDLHWLSTRTCRLSAPVPPEPCISPELSQLAATQT